MQSANNMNAIQLPPSAFASQVRYVLPETRVINLPRSVRSPAGRNPYRPAAHQADRPQTHRRQGATQGARDQGAHAAGRPRARVTRGRVYHHSQSTPAAGGRLGRGQHGVVPCFASKGWWSKQYAVCSCPCFIAFFFALPPSSSCL